MLLFRARIKVAMAYKMNRPHTTLTAMVVGSTHLGAVCGADGTCVFVAATAACGLDHW